VFSPSVHSLPFAWKEIRRGPTQIIVKLILPVQKKQILLLLESRMAYKYKVLQFGSNDDTKNAKSFQKILNDLGSKDWKVVASGGAGGESSSYGYKEGWIILMREV